jgi:alkyl hydroperoxide reductase subunit AhpC
MIKSTQLLQEFSYCNKKVIGFSTTSIKSEINIHIWYAKKERKYNQIKWPIKSTKGKKVDDKIGTNAKYGGIPL